MMTITMNAALAGIEVSFDSKPIRATLDALKANGFRWNHMKKIWYAKNTPERMKAVQALDNVSNSSDTVKAERKAQKAKAQLVNKYGVKVGDVFYDSWGYEQTNIDFYQVVALKGQTTVELRAINKEHRSIGFCSDMVKPIKDSFKAGGYITRLQDGESITRRLKDYGAPGHPSIRAGAELLSLTDWETEHNETSYY